LFQTYTPPTGQNHSAYPGPGGQSGGYPPAPNVGTGGSQSSQPSTASYSTQTPYPATLSPSAAGTAQSPGYQQNTGPQTPG
jgi:hypothetical protein